MRKRIKVNKYRWLKRRCNLAIEAALDKVIAVLDRDRDNTLWLFDEKDVVLPGETAQAYKDATVKMLMRLGKRIIKEQKRKEREITMRTRQAKAVSAQTKEMLERLYNVYRPALESRLGLKRGTLRYSTKYRRKENNNEDK